MQFKRVTNRVAEEPIDSYIVYRRLMANETDALIKGIFQRDVESFPS